VRPHKAAVSEEFMASDAMAIAGNTAYSPGLAPSDFYLFDHMKRLLGRESFETEERLLSAVESVFRFLEKWTLIKAFLEWMKRLEQYIESDGDYVE
jgi:hypothetical protein